MSWIPPEDAEQRLQPEFWKPKKEGETMTGMIAGFGKNRNGVNMTLAPCVWFPSGDNRPQGFAQIAIGLNATLNKKLNPNRDTGKCVAVSFTETVDTPNGKMRVFEVHILKESHMREYLNKYADGLEMPDSPPATAPAPQYDDFPEALDEEDDDLPF